MTVVALLQLLALVKEADEPLRTKSAALKRPGSVAEPEVTTGLAVICSQGGGQKFHSEPGTFP